MSRAVKVLSMVVLMSGAACATAPPPAPVPPSYEMKLSWILRLEDQRVLSDPTPPPVAMPVQRGRQMPPLPVFRPDLLALLHDDEARVRRRAALAIGRVGLSGGVAPLVDLLPDPEPEVRQMAVFALGLIGDATATEVLTGALTDPSPLVQGRAAEALGRLGVSSAAADIGTMVARHIGAAAAASLTPDDVDYPLAPEVEAFRLGVYALARLRAYEPLARVVLEGDQPRLHWWPIAWALCRIEDRRAMAALATFTRVEGVYCPMYAAQGLGALRDPAALDTLLPLLELDRVDRRVTLAALRAVAQTGDTRATPAVLRILKTTGIGLELEVEAIDALGAIKAHEATDTLLDLLSHRVPAIRSAALRALARLDDTTFITVLSGLDPDSEWFVRSALASLLGTLPRELAEPRLLRMLKDADPRVIPAVLSSLAKLSSSTAAEAAREALANDDLVIRMAAARLVGDLKPDWGAEALVEGYRRGQADVSYLARAAALAALASYGWDRASATLQEAFGDRDWAVRVQAARLWHELGGDDEAVTIRPAPTSRSEADYAAPSLVSPPYSPQAYIETDRGTIQIELNVIDAPLTAANFITLARKGFFDGVAFHRVVPNFVVQGGDPRGDGEGGPGYTIRDELNEVPYLPGTVGMALDWADTGGSQFFVTRTPQPHLDGHYTAFGRVVDGMDVVARLQQGDAIRRVRVWDGTTMGDR